MIFILRVNLISVSFNRLVHDVSRLFQLPCELVNFNLLLLKQFVESILEFHFVVLFLLCKTLREFISFFF